MNATEAKKLLEPIPKTNFIIGVFTDGKSSCCAIGHLVRLKSENINNFSGDNCFDHLNLEINDFVRNKVRRYLRQYHNTDGFDDLSDVNNFKDVNGYNEDNPKDRVMHLLDDMIKEGY